MTNKIYAYIPTRKQTVLLTSSKLVPFLTNNFKYVSFKDSSGKFCKSRYAFNCLPNRTVCPIVKIYQVFIDSLQIGHDRKRLETF